MYKTITYKSLAYISIVLSCLLILSSLANTFLPAVAVFKEQEKKVIIVMYHQISENHALWGDYVIPASLLKNDFEHLKNNGYTAVRIKDVLDFTKGNGDLPEKSVVITFDDGQRSFLTKVLPLLEEYNFPANINIVGSLVDLYSENGETDDRYAYLNWNDIKILSEHPLVEIGHHSYNFHSLGLRKGMGKIYGESNSAYMELIKTDIEMLNNKLLSNIGFVPFILAYPYGIKNKTLEEIVKSEGFSVTLSCRESVNKISVGDELFDLGRFNRPYKYSTNTFFTEIATG
jgi:peptidoglycan/xylan/chitin deacetylase (PgdA/CDA1 family)